MPKIKEKEKAIILRKNGYSYSEILKEIAVAKSTLSLWLRSVNLAKKQKQRLTEKRLKAAIRGGLIKRKQRQLITEEIKKKAQEEVGNLSKREKWLIGIALYWAEGAKEKDYRPGAIVAFSNSEARMARLFQRWLKEFCSIKMTDLNYELYIHENAKWQEAQNYWSKALFVQKEFIKIYFKKNKINTNRRNTDENYHGLIRVKVKKSINLNRKIDGWINGISKQWGMV